MRLLFVALLALVLSSCFLAPQDEPLPVAGEYQHIPYEMAVSELSSTIARATVTETVTVYDQTYTIYGNRYLDQLNDYLGVNYSFEDFADFTIGQPVAVRSLVDTSDLNQLRPQGLDRMESRQWDASVNDMRMFHSGMYYFDIYDGPQYLLTVRVSQAIGRYDGFSPSITNQRLDPDTYYVTTNGMEVQASDPDGLRTLAWDEAGWTIRTSHWGPVLGLE